MSRKKTVIIIGAGPAGIGVAAALQRVGVTDVCILEKGAQVGTTFLSWPSFVSFLTPSFQSNSFHLPDLNAITPNSSPGHSLQTQHPSGKGYAAYLAYIAEELHIPVQCNVEVTSLEQKKQFVVHTTAGKFTADYVVWAGGEFSYPSFPDMKGASLCTHYAHLNVEELRQRRGRQCIIGSYESGLDCAYFFAQHGMDADVYGDNPTLSDDPSVTLAPRTFDRIRDSVFQKHIRSITERVVSVEECEDGYRVSTHAGSEVYAYPPILCTGFMQVPPLMTPHVSIVDGVAQLTSSDESTLRKGLFFTGPSVKHGTSKYCFVYKFRQRFPVVAAAIARRLGHDPGEMVRYYKKNTMYIKNPTSCGPLCEC